MAAVIVAVAGVGWRRVWCITSPSGACSCASGRCWRAANHRAVGAAMLLLLLQLLVQTLAQLPVLLLSLALLSKPRTAPPPLPSLQRPSAPARLSKPHKEPSPLPPLQRPSPSQEEARSHCPHCPAQALSCSCTASWAPGQTGAAKCTDWLL